MRRSALSNPPAAGVDQALRTGDDEALFRAVARMTAGLTPMPALPCASSPTRRPGTDAAPCVEAHATGAPRPMSQSHQIGTGTAGEEVTSPSPATPAEDDDDPELLEYQRTHRWERQACGECCGRGFYYIPADFTHFRWCAACDGAGVVLRLVEMSAEEVHP